MSFNVIFINKHAKDVEIAKSNDIKELGIAKIEAKNCINNSLVGLGYHVVDTVCKRKGVKENDT